MPNYNEQMQRIFEQYEKAGMPTPATAREIAAWAVHNKLWHPRPADVISQCADDLAKALREEYRTDKRGRRYRSKAAARIVKEDGKQQTLWADIDTAPREHMEKAFSQRRRQIVGDCHQLTVDAAHYNDNHSNEPPIQIILDFTMDVLEIDASLIPKELVNLSI